MTSASKDNAAKNAARCRPRRLAATPVVSVDGCGCGSMRIHVGPVTLRLNANAAAALVATVSRALAGLSTVPCPKAANERQEAPFVHYGDA